MNLRGVVLFARDLYRKYRPLSDHTFDLNGSAQILGELFCDAEPQSRTAELSSGGAVHLLEFVEDDRQAPFGYADASVQNLELKISVDVRGYSHGAAFGKLDGIVDKFARIWVRIPPSVIKVGRLCEYFQTKARFW